MFRKKEDRGSANDAQVYATKRDFCRIFEDHKTGLYLLSLLLTADAEKAEQCFVAGLQDSTHGNPVFREWALSWSKRQIIKNAIRMISPRQEQRGAQPAFEPTPSEAKLDSSLATVLRLASYERIVFVMSVLEGYSVQECLTLLNSSKQEIVSARARALFQLAEGAQIAPVSLRKDDFSSSYFLQPAQVA